MPPVSVCRDAEKSLAGLLQQAREARSAIEGAVSAAAAAVQQLEASKQEEKEAASELAEARGLLKRLESAARRR